ncbi:hypothetical protein [Helicobacter trogontum]|uniref:Uncharacterized protein n=1 Tax=Helicobacter trogontum TaxID=50960 RepID=A0A4U8SDW2_9HELI|nr:hypothetical protein [Helicobacter trogontum]TLD84350.1 hypothetical protein LS81_002500 [Helicobacter trogontum]
MYKRCLQHKDLKQKASIYFFTSFVSHYLHRIYLLDSYVNTFVSYDCNDFLLSMDVELEQYISFNLMACVIKANMIARFSNVWHTPFYFKIIPSKVEIRIDKFDNVNPYHILLYNKKLNIADCRKTIIGVNLSGAKDVYSIFILHLKDEFQHNFYVITQHALLALIRICVTNNNTLLFSKLIVRYWKIVLEHISYLYNIFYLFLTHRKDYAISTRKFS